MIIEKIRNFKDKIAISSNLKFGSYNIIGPDFLTIKELISKFNSILNYHFSTKYTTLTPIENIQKIDDRKIREELNIDIHNTIDSFIKSLRNDKKQ